MRTNRRVVVSAFIGVVGSLLIACAGSPEAPTPSVATVQLVLLASTVRPADTTPEQLECVESTWPTHAHPSWHNFQDALLNAVGNDHLQLTLNDVPVDQKVQITLWDQNWCNPGHVGFVSSGLSANGAVLAQNWWYDEQQPGFEFTVDASGHVRQQR